MTNSKRADGTETDAAERWLNKNDPERNMRRRTARVSEQDMLYRALKTDTNGAVPATDGVRQYALVNGDAPISVIPEYEQVPGCYHTPSAGDSDGDR